MTLVVKLGSSIVAADDGELRADVLDSVCAQVAELEAGGERVVMVTSGAIARGMRLLEIEKRPKAMDELQAASAVGQGDLFQAYEQRLRQHGTRAAQVLLTRADIQRRSHYLNARQTLERLIHWRVVPVINENDTTASEEINFGDNDFLAAQVSVFLRARLLVLLTNTQGLYTADPRSDRDATLIERLEEFSELDGVQMSQTSTFGRGGMVSKVAAAEKASRAGVEVVICNGTESNALRDAVAGRNVGTRIAPMRRSGKTLPVLKLWMKHGQQPTGAVIVDAGAAEMLRDKGSSLLAVGIDDTKGRFEAGDVVDVIDGSTGRPVGRGIVDLSSQDLMRVLGRKSVEVMNVIPNAPKQVIHRDRFVLI